MTLRGAAGDAFQVDMASMFCSSMTDATIPAGGYGKGQNRVSGGALVGFFRRGMTSKEGDMMLSLRGCDVSHGKGLHGEARWPLWR